MMWLAKVYITLKPVVNDPQGLAIKSGLATLGFEGVDTVRAGKYLEIKLESPDAEAARAQVAEMCRKLLANPVIEDYRYEVERLK